MTTIRTPRAVTAGARASYRSVLAVGEFRVLLAGLLVYGLGFEFEILGLSVLVYARTGSGLLAAVAFSAGFAPQAVAGAFFTSLADRLPPRALISGGLLARAAPGLVIGLASAMPVPLALTVAAAAALVTPVLLASSSGLLPEILDGDGYTLGRSLVGTVSAGTQIAALGLGGALLSVLPPRWLLILAGALLAASALVTRLGLRARPARASAGDGAGSRDADAVDGRARGAVRATLAGNRELLATPGLRRLLLVQWLPTWFATGAEALAVPYTESVGHPASAASLLLAAGPCGMLAGTIVVGRLCAPAVRERLVPPLAVLVGVPLLAFAWRPPLAIAALALTLSGAALAYTLGLQRAFADTVPPHLRGQGFGLASTGLMGGQGLLPSALGGVATALGASGAMAVAGAGVVASALLTRPLPLRQAGAPGAQSPGHSLLMSVPGMRVDDRASVFAGRSSHAGGPGAAKCRVQTSGVVDGDA